MHGMTPAPEPEKASAVAHPGQPAATLDPGTLDGPAETSVRESDRAAALATAMSGHAMSHGTYSQTDAGRDDARAPVPSTPDPHAGHAMPPSPSPIPKENE
jgi:hypothetical protein